ncbi:hypothetical protein LTR37_003425 [Vermiconidia calcicola]|uniref:Uncharacterized protein n=1 Tax=Vermiconidia calcicola TaxID=1690605 RepID=A0ACC3NS07_9PEZI|nr:hypothetical protein LTR37_003425 [Vermiconidia calcicola]
MQQNQLETQQPSEAVNCFANFDATYELPDLAAPETPKLPSHLVADHRVHVRFPGLLPKPDHRSGKLIYAPAIQAPAQGTIAQRRVEHADQIREHYIARCFQYYREDCPEEIQETWDPVNWREEPHPGVRVKFGKEDGEVSPKTCMPFYAQTYSAVSRPWTEPEEALSVRPPLRTRRTSTMTIIPKDESSCLKVCGTVTS